MKEGATTGLDGCSFQLWGCGGSDSSETVPWGAPGTSSSPPGFSPDPGVPGEGG